MSLRCTTCRKVPAACTCPKPRLGPYHCYSRMGELAQQNSELADMRRQQRQPARSIGELDDACVKRESRMRNMGPSW